MDDAALVRGGEAVGDLRADVEDLAAPAADRSLISVRRSRPSMYSITMYGVPSAAPTSWMVTMFGWFSAEAERASCVKRVSVSRSPARRSGQELDRHFAAQLRIAGDVHLAHSAGADGAEDFVVTEGLARLSMDRTGSWPDSTGGPTSAHGFLGAYNPPRSPRGLAS